MARRPAPPRAASTTPPTVPRRDTHLMASQAHHLTVRCAQLGVSPTPWLVWAEAKAAEVGSAEALRRALLGAASEPAWDRPARRWWRVR